MIHTLQTLNKTALGSILHQQHSHETNTLRLSLYASESVKIKLMFQILPHI